MDKTLQCFMCGGISPIKMDAIKYGAGREKYRCTDRVACNARCKEDVMKARLMGRQ